MVVGQPFGALRLGRQPFGCALRLGGATALASRTAVLPGDGMHVCWYYASVRFARVARLLSQLFTDLFFSVPARDGVRAVSPPEGLHPLVLAP